MRFICGHCGELICDRKNCDKHFASFVPHEACGYETFFPTHIYMPSNPDPKPGEARRLPSSVDLDTVADEQKQKELTEADDASDAQKQVEESGGWVGPKRSRKKSQ